MTRKPVFSEPEQPKNSAFKKKPGGASHPIGVYHADQTI